jgi:hypothetical protein
MMQVKNFLLTLGRWHNFIELPWKFELAQIAKALGLLKF